MERMLAQCSSPSPNPPSAIYQGKICIRELETGKTLCLLLYGVFAATRSSATVSDTSVHLIKYLPVLDFP